ncbi:SMI1/KNR4 family protein [Thioclava sp. FR2]|uniref:SMI1/KNR4 family protein n=1 Tax=Thioclava sp. FR2 TaxID=3445780 RepID=UPI003EB73092
MPPLDLIQFSDLHRQKSVQRARLFELDPPDPPASDEQISDLESKLATRIPETYISFLKAYGGGSFGLTNVFSAARDSEYYSVPRNAAAQAFMPEGSLALSDDHCGGWYVLRVSECQALEPVFYWHSDRGVEKTKFANILEYVAAYAYDGA